jgi:hypothetical protein
MKKLFLNSIAALLLATGTAHADNASYCTILCMQEVPRGKEYAELDKSANKRCVPMCGDKAACEWVLQNAKDHKLRSVTGRCEKE